MQDVVVTRVGMVTSGGVGRGAAWQALVEGRSGLKQIELFATAEFTTRKAYEVAPWKASTYWRSRTVAYYTRSTQFAYKAAEECLEAVAPEERGELGIVLGSQFSTVHNYHKLLEEPDFMTPIKFLSTLPSSIPTKVSIAYFERVGDLFDDDKNAGRKRPFSMRALMRAVIDHDGGHLESWGSQAGAETAIVWDAHLGGHPVCLLGIESQNVPRLGHRPSDGPEDWNGGTLFRQSSKKLARALNAASGNRPVVILANLSGFDGSPESMRKLQLEYGAEIARAVVGFQGRMVFLVVSRYHGGAYVVFSRELNPELRAIAVEGSYASVIGGAPPPPWCSGGRCGHGWRPTRASRLCAPSCGTVPAPRSAPPSITWSER